MPDTVDHEIITRLKTAEQKDIMAERRCIVLNPLLTKVLQCLAVFGIATEPSDFAPEVIAKTCTAPTKRLSDGRAHRRLSAADLT